MARSRPRFSRAALAAALTVVLLIPFGRVPAIATAAPTADGMLPTAQLNGVAFAQVVIGDTVYVGGLFTEARPAGSPAGRRVERRVNLLAYDLDTGLLRSWAPRTNGVVRALAASPDGRTVYAAGSFTTVNGSTRERVVALAASTGGVRAGFHPRLNGPASAIAVHGSTVYIGGAFTSAGGVTRTRAAAFDRRTGALRPWRPLLDGEVLALVVSTSGRSAVLGGRFRTVNGRTEPGSQRVGTGSGRKNLTWRLNTVVGNHGDASAVFSLSSSGGYVYGTGYAYGSAVPHRLEGAFVASWSTGKPHWIEDCHGDSYAAARSGPVVYVVGHAHDCRTIGGFGESRPRVHHRALAFTQAATGVVQKNRVRPYSDFGGRPAPTLLPWMPDFDTGTATGQDQGPWSVVTSGRWVLIAGEFRTVDGVHQQGLVRFHR
ncbi:hypothetical protein [Amnibacterium soli]|uniref:hypothetical protein n=1 Tax=Amnibacterium soli TaxID=1282736 RepID=UPI0031EFFF34